MSGVGAFIVGAAIGAVAAKQHQKNHNKHHNHHHQSTRTVVVHHPPQPVHQTHLVYASNPAGAPHYPHGQSHGYPHGHPHGPPPHGHQPPHYCPPHPHSPQVYYQSVPEGPRSPPPIGFICPPSPASPQGPPPYGGGYPSPYPPPAVPSGYSHPHAHPQPGGYPPVPPCVNYPPQSPGYPPTSPGYPNGGYPPLPNAAQSSPSPRLPPPPQPSGYPFASPSAHPQPASAAPFQPPQHLQAQVPVQQSAVFNQQTTDGSNAAARLNRRCFIILNEETRYALQVDTVAGSKLVMRQRTVTGSWDPQWQGQGQGQDQGQGQLWYLDGEGILRSQLNDFAVESKDGGSWLCLAPYRGDSRQQWIIREGRILSHKVSPSDCICLEEGLMGTAVNADVIVTKYQSRPHHHWVIEYV